MTPNEIIQNYELLPHPEGGYYKEVYRSKESIPSSALPLHGGERNSLTSIYFLLNETDKSHFHILKSDEIWYFHSGTSAIIHMLKDGKYSFKRIGNNNAAGDDLQVVIPANTYFAAEVVDQQGFVFVSCAVAPGFDFADFSMPNASDLTKQFPEESALIEQFTFLK